MNKKTFVSLLLSCLLIFTMTACSLTTVSKTPPNTSEAPKSAEEIVAKISELQEQENAILMVHLELWQTFYDAMNECDTTKELKENYNYGNQLLENLETIKDRYTKEDYKTLKHDAEKIIELEKQIQPLFEQYEAMMAEASSNNAEANSIDATTALQTFPKFEGKDLDGNPVDNHLFSEHSVTVMNFWYTTCNPCVEELDILENLNKKLAADNGVVVGVNAFTQNGDEKAIADAKAVLEKKGATYPNICFGSDSEAGKFTEQMSLFPTTYVVDRDGHIVGEPILGGLSNSEQMEQLEKLIDKALGK